MLRRNLHWLFAGLYLLGLFAFAFVFERIATDFFFSPQAIREDVDRQTRVVMRQLQASQINHHRKHIGNLSNGWMVWNEGVRLDDVSASNDGTVRLRFHLPTYQIVNGERGYVIYPVVVATHIERFPAGLPDSLEPSLRSHFARVEKLDHPGLRAALFDSILTNPIYGGLVGGLTFSTEEEAGLLALVDAEKGVSSGLGGGYWRFWYLSAVTITTLGYGDVVPMTTRARVLIGSEAVFGVFCAGAFLSRFLSRSLPRAAPPGGIHQDRPSMA